MIVCYEAQYAEENENIRLLHLCYCVSDRARANVTSTEVAETKNFNAIGGGRKLFNNISMKFRVVLSKIINVPTVQFS